jgi:cobalt-zinc-cadmium efflux system protein
VIFFNSVITIAQFMGGLLSGSLALVSDAWHNLSDVLALMLGYAGEKVSGMPGGRQFTFGLKRFEVLIALVNALALIVIGIYIVYEAVIRFMNPVSVDVSIMLPVAFVGLLGNGLSIIALVKNRHDNLNMRAAFLHLFYDTLSSVAVIAAAIIMRYTGYVWIDLAISVGIVFMIVWSSMDIIVESLRIFMQSAPVHLDIEEVEKSILRCEHIAGVHGLHVWSVSSSELFLSCHVSLREGLSSSINTDDIIRSINSMLADEYHISHTTIQVERSRICASGDNTCCNQVMH